MTPEEYAQLRKPFDPKAIGKLPKGGVQLDFVGHAAVTDRLLAVDPNWTWEPFAVGEDGLPAYQNGALWIRLTVCGVTRIGVGDGPDPKQRIGDAIRNAAMRFGVALDLWSRQELENTDPNGGGDETRQHPSTALPEATADQVSGRAVSGPAETPDPPSDDPVDVAPSTEDVVQSLRDRAISATSMKKRDGLQLMARLNFEAAKAKVMQAPTTRPDGSATTLGVLFDEAMRRLNTTAEPVAS